MSILPIRAMCCIRPIVCSKFPWYYIYTLLRKFTVNRSTAMINFSYMEYVLKVVLTFINFPVWNHLFTSSMMWWVWSTLQPIGDWETRKFRYLRIYTSWNLISNASSKTLDSSVNDVSLLLVLRTYSAETVR